MPNASLNINQIALDKEFYVWGSGEDIRRFNGSSWDYFNYLNSAVPSGAPYSLDTRCVSMDPYDNLWCGVAEGPTSGFNEVAVFYINTNNVTEGKSWNFSDLGDFGGVPQEISLIYACPYGDDVFAFASPLNGIGGTAGLVNYTRTYGVTGGRLFYYLTDIDKWAEAIPDYNWPIIYSIETKGFNGTGYYYYLGTSEGLYVIPQGALSKVSLTDGTEIIRQAEVYNTSTSGIISNTIYSLDFDEAGNLWMGTDKGLSYFNGCDFWNYGTTGPVTLVKARPNGHVFYAMGDGELMQGTGIWHFNGYTHTNFNTSNSPLEDNNLLGIELVNSNVTQSGLKVLEDGLWILGYNTLANFDYDIPHVYGSSNYTGATGWNFTYYTPTGGTGAPLPRIDKYTWAYPSWEVYDQMYLAFKHPGLDPRNLFLTTELSAIADGEAGAIPYWDNFPIPTYNQTVLSEKISDPFWSSEVTVSAGPNGATAGFNITCSTTLNIRGKNRVFVGGYLEGEGEAQVGYYNDSTPAIITNTNPSIGGTSGSYVDSKMGFVYCLNAAGVVESIVTFPGYSTKVDSISSSPDQNSVIVSGCYDWLIENGSYVYSGYDQATYLYESGPTGAPFGITNQNVPGLTTDYPWIYNTSSATGSNWLFANYSIVAMFYIYSSGNLGASSGTFDFVGATGGTPTYLGEVTKIVYNVIDAVANNWASAFQNLPIGYTLNISGGLGYFTINSVIVNEPGMPSNTVSVNVTYQYSSLGYYYTLSSVAGPKQMLYYDYSNYSFPLVPGLPSIQPFIQGGTSAIGIFVAEIEKDLGDRTTFTGITGDYQKTIRDSYRVINFRTFPSAYLSSTNTIDNFYTLLDTTKYSVNVAIVGDTQDLSGLNSLKGSSDYETVSDYIKDSSSTNFTSIVKMDKESFYLTGIVNSAGTTSGYQYRSVNSIDSLLTENSTLITGNADLDFSMGGISLDNASESEKYPYFFIVGPTGVGVTGAFVQSASPDKTSSIKSTKDDAYYYLSTIFGGSGSYLGNNFIAGSSGTYILTAQITEQATDTNIFYNYFEIGATSEFGDLVFARELANSQYMVGYTKSTYPYLSIYKSDDKGRIMDSKDFGEFVYSSGNFTLTSDPSSNIYVGAFNSTGVTSGGYSNMDPSTGFVLKANQYVAPLGINLGNIISRPGAGAWTWCDLHLTNSDYLEIPLMSTVIFSNYSSNIYGKNNNKWALNDEETGENLLTIKTSPYFIYTFTFPGYYSIQNEVQDSAGNVYTVSKPGFIRVVDHKVKRPDDRDPNFVNSTDYGYPEPFVGRDDFAKQVAANMLVDEAEILKNNVQPFGAQVIIPGNPDATFNEGEIQ